MYSGVWLMNRLDKDIDLLNARVDWLDENINMGFTERLMSELLEDKDTIKELRDGFIYLKRCKELLNNQRDALERLMDRFEYFENMDDETIKHHFDAAEEAELNDIEEEETDGR